VLCFDRYNITAIPVLKKKIFAVRKIRIRPVCEKRRLTILIFPALPQAYYFNAMRQKNNKK
jgi:hypothetical protein